MWRQGIARGSDCVTASPLSCWSILDTVRGDRGSLFLIWIGSLWNFQSNLRDGNLCFFMLISRWFVMHFGVLLYDFELSCGGLMSIYEWSSKQLKTRNFHFFLKRFLRWKNRVTCDVWGIFWKMDTKLGRKKKKSFCGHLISRFWTFLRDLEKNVIFKKRFVSSDHKI